MPNYENSVFEFKQTLTASNANQVSQNINLSRAPYGQIRTVSSDTNINLEDLTGAFLDADLYTDPSSEANTYWGASQYSVFLGRDQSFISLHAQMVFEVSTTVGAWARLEVGFPGDHSIGHIDVSSGSYGLSSSERILSVSLPSLDPPISVTSQTNAEVNIFTNISSLKLLSGLNSFFAINYLRRNY